MKTFSGNQRKLVKLFNETGFTLVEMLCAFSIFLLIISFFPFIFQLLNKNVTIDERLQKMEWEVFVGQIKKEIRMSESISVLNNKLILNKDSQSIMYEKYGASIRRRVNLTGHEVLLQNIKAVTFELVTNGIRVSVIDNFGQNESSIIRMIVNKDSPYAS